MAPEYKIEKGEAYTTLDGGMLEATVREMKHAVVYEEDNNTMLLALFAHEIDAKACLRTLRELGE